MIQFLRGTQVALTSSNTVFSEGQPIFEKDTGRLKIGDGSSVYSALKYIGESSTSYSVHFDPDKPAWNGYVDLNDSIRLVFGKLNGKFNAVTGQLEDRFTLAADGTTKLGFPSNTSLLESSTVLSMYGMKSKFLLLNVSAQSGDPLAVYSGGTYFGNTGTNTDVALGYFGHSVGFNYECYGIFLTWD